MNVAISHVLTRVIMITVVTITSFKSNLYSESVNVALGKRTRFCDTLDLSGRLTDGDLSDESTERNISERSSMCSDNAYVDVDLVDSFYIHYVVVYQGKGSTSVQLDHFIVNQFVAGKMVKCSEYPGLSAGDGKGMFLTCQPHQPSNKVRVESRVNEGMVISEIQVHAIGEDDGLAFRGCYQSFQGVQRPAVDLKTCKSVCSQSHDFVAMKAKRSCFCGNQPEADEVSSERCFMKCDGTVGRSCGGEHVYSVYLANIRFPYHIGCFSFSLDSDMALLFENISRIGCLQFCDSFQFAILMSGFLCVCKNEVTWTKGSVMYSDCSAVCISDISQFCGGLKSASVYKTCLFSNTSLKCSNTFRCSGGWNEVGMCKAPCEAGFIGKHCLEKEYLGCSFPNPCTDLPNMECVKNDDKSTCICQTGFSKETSDICQDIDECASSPCDSMSSICVNFNGSYECQCRPDFYKLTEYLCRENSTSDDPFLLIRELSSWILIILAIASVLFVVITLRLFYVEPPTSSRSSNTLSSEFSKKIKE